MGASSRLNIFFLVATFTLIVAVDVTELNAETRLPVIQSQHNADVQNSASAMKLLSTLQTLYNSLITQIAVLDAKLKTSLSENEISEATHLVQHYTAQKNNIEREISLIQSIESSPSSASVPRHILANISPEEKIVPSLLNIFKKTKPTTDTPSNDFTYSNPYPSYYYPNYGPTPPYPYQGIPAKPNYMYPNNLVQSTFAGYEMEPNSNQQTFPVQNQVITTPDTVKPQPKPLPQINLQGEIPPPQVEPQRISNTYPTQPQFLSNPQSAEVQSSHVPLHQQNGQMQGVFIYYPNAIVTEDEEQERPSIVDRVGQAIDRFGQAITNLAMRQSLRSSSIQKSDSAPTRIRVVYNQPRSSPNQKIAMGRRLDDKKPKLRWVSV